MPIDNVVGFLSSDGISTYDLTLARKLYDTNASLSFRQAAHLANSPLPFLDRRKVSNAASFRYYMFGDTPSAEPEYVSGNELLGQDYALGHGDVNVDDIITAHKVVGDRDMAVSHIQMAPLLGQENGRKVAIELDRRILNQFALAARTAAATKNGLALHNGGQRVTRSGGNTAVVATALATAYPKSATGAANFRSDLRDLGYLADTNFWPEESRWLIVDAYMRQVLQADASGTLFSKDYQEDNKILNRQINLIDGWKVMFWEKRVSQGGLMPDSNVSSYTRSAKFNANFLPQASVGYPVAIAFCAAGEDQAAVGFGTWVGMQSVVNRQDRKHDTMYETWCLTGIEKEKVYNAASIEVIL